MSGTFVNLKKIFALKLALAFVTLEQSLCQEGFHFYMIVEGFRRNIHKILDGGNLVILLKLRTVLF